MPPTTGIGPGIERMAMIFTGQENIDDIIFFPMMRPSISPLNAAIFGQREASVQPVEDLALTLEDFEALCGQGAFKPHARHLFVKPHLRFWANAGVTGHVEIDGFLPNSVLRLAASLGNAEAASPEKKVQDRMEHWLPAFLKKKFPHCEVTVSPATGIREHD
jgi:hypothetical protein